MSDPVNPWAPGPWESNQWENSPFLDDASAEAPVDADAPAAPSPYQELTASWPTVEAVIDARDFVTSRMDDPMNTPDDKSDDVYRDLAAYKHWEAEWKEKPAQTIQCFDWARYQLFKANLDAPILHYQVWLKPATATIDTPPEQLVGGVNMTNSIEAVRYTKETLASGKPVLAGLWLKTYNSLPNKDKSTNHFVVIVGMATDDHGCYFSYYDALDAGPSLATCRFYLADHGGQLLIQDRFAYRTVTQVRKSLPA